VALFFIRKKAHLRQNPNPLFSLFGLYTSTAFLNKFLQAASMLDQTVKPLAKSIFIAASPTPGKITSAAFISAGSLLKIALYPNLSIANIMLSLLRNLLLLVSFFLVSSLSLSLKFTQNQLKSYYNIPWSMAKSFFRYRVLQPLYRFGESLKNSLNFMCSLTLRL
jgi:hypothetical protein